MTIFAPIAEFFTKRRDVDTDALHQWRKVDEAEKRLLRGVAAAVKAGRDRVTLDNLAYLVAPHAHLKAPPSGGYEFHTMAQALDAMISALGAGILSALNHEVTLAAKRELDRFNELLRSVRAAKKGYAQPRNYSLVAAGLVTKDIFLDYKTVNDRALSQITLEHLDLIEQFTLDQRKVVFKALRDGVARGLNPLDVARQIKSTVTLTEWQMQAVDRYRYALENAHRDVRSAANALNRGLRDARSDRSVKAARRSGEALSNGQINSMVDRYRANYAHYRAKTIARTEALRSTHQGEAAVWETAIRRGDVQAEQVVQRWVTARDEKVRHSHASMMGQIRAWGKPFTTGRAVSLRYPGDRKAPPEETINCRCVVVRTLKPAQQRREPERRPVDVRPIPQVGVGGGNTATPPVEIGAPAGAPLSFDLSRVGSGYAMDAETAIVEVDVKALDAAWRRGPPDYYLPPGTVGKVPNIQAAAEGGFSVPVPEVALDADGAIAFTDGRHRVVYVRDISGQRYIPVAVPAEQREEFLRLFAPSVGERSSAATAQLSESMGAVSSRRRGMAVIDAGQIAEAQRAALVEEPLTADEVAQQATGAMREVQTTESASPLTPQSMGARSSRRAARENGAYIGGDLTGEQSIIVGDLSADYAARFGYLPFNSWDVPKSKYKAVVAALRRALKDGVSLTNAERVTLISRSVEFADFGERAVNARNSKLYQDRFGNAALSEAERDVLARYSDTGYRYINTYLRGGPDWASQLPRGVDINSDLALLRQLFKRASFPENVTVYRGIESKFVFEELAQKLSQGSVAAIDKGFSSTTLSKKVANSFSNGRYNLKILVPKGSRALYASNVGEHALESEVLLDENSEFIVRSVSNSEIVLELIIK